MRVFGSCLTALYAHENNGKVKKNNNTDGKMKLRHLPTMPISPKKLETVLVNVIVLFVRLDGILVIRKF